MPRPLAVAVLLAVVPAACAPRDHGADKDFTRLTAFTQAVAGADKVILYEGLPHPHWERGVLDQEIKSHDTFEDHGFRFYSGPMDVKPPDAAKLTALASDLASFAKFGGLKTCGGFHPDYLAEWQTDGGVYRMHICLGCYEVKIYGPRSNLYCDMAARDGFKTILTPYRKNRPAPQPQ